MTRIRCWLRPTRRTAQDEGAILPLVMVGSFLVASIVAGVATYVSADLRYARDLDVHVGRQVHHDQGRRAVPARLGRRGRQLLARRQLVPDAGWLAEQPVLRTR
ncbi:MAG: hypothetical protein ACOYMR_18630 [Ilumatobacteraceae bacterium]